MPLCGHPLPDREHSASHCGRERLFDDMQFMIQLSRGSMPMPPVDVPGAYRSHVTLLFANCALPFTIVYASVGVGTDLPVPSLQLYGDMLPVGPPMPPP